MTYGPASARSAPASRPGSAGEEVHVGRHVPGRARTAVHRRILPPGRVSATPASACLSCRTAWWCPRRGRAPPRRGHQGDPPWLLTMAALSWSPMCMPAAFGRPRSAASSWWPRRCRPPRRHPGAGDHGRLPEAEELAAGRDRPAGQGGDSARGIHGKKHWPLPLLAFIKQVGPDVCHVRSAISN